MEGLWLDHSKTRCGIFKFKFFLHLTVFDHFIHCMIFLLQDMFSEKMALIIQSVTLISLITIPATVTLLIEPNPCMFL